jgi:hypothetical protein
LDNFNKEEAKGNTEGYLMKKMGKVVILDKPKGTFTMKTYSLLVIDQLIDFDA